MFIENHADEDVDVAEFECNDYLNFLTSLSASSWITSVCFLQFEEDSFVLRFFLKKLGI